MHCFKIIFKKCNEIFIHFLIGDVLAGDGHLDMLTPSGSFLTIE